MPTLRTKLLRTMWTLTPWSALAVIGVMWYLGLPATHPSFAIRHAPIGMALQALLEPRPDCSTEWEKRLTLRRPQDASALRHMLTSASDRLRWMAADALGTMQDTNAVEDVIHLLERDASFQVRYTAARALAAIGDKRAIDPLLTAISDPDTCVRNASVEALAAMRVVRAIPAIEAFSKTNDYPSAQYCSDNALRLLRSLDATSRMWVGVGSQDQDPSFRLLLSRNGSNWCVIPQQRMRGGSDWLSLVPAAIIRAASDHLEFTAMPEMSLRLAFLAGSPPVTNASWHAELTDAMSGSNRSFTFIRE